MNRFLEQICIRVLSKPSMPLALVPVVFTEQARRESFAHISPFFKRSRAFMLFGFRSISRSSFRLFAVAFVLPSLVTAAGCAGKGDSNIVPAAGTVMFKGQPVEGAHVTFASDDSSRVSYGRTGANGRFQLTTVTEGDGALIGTHKVTIMKQEIVGEVRPAGLGEDGPDYEKYEDAPIPQTRSLLPDRYSRPDTSDLTANVAAGGDNDFSFDLAD